MALGIPSYRPTITGTTHMVSSGHYLAAAAGYRILEEGGNAIDAGVASGLAINVLFPHWTSFGGVAPIDAAPRGEERDGGDRRPGALAPCGLDRLLQPERRRGDPRGHPAVRHTGRGRRLVHGAEAVRHDELRAGGDPGAGAGREGDAGRSAPFRPPWSRGRPALNPGLRARRCCGPHGRPRPTSSSQEEGRRRSERCWRRRTLRPPSAASSTKSGPTRPRDARRPSRRHVTCSTKVRWPRRWSASPRSRGDCWLWRTWPRTRCPWGRQRGVATRASTCTRVVSGARARW